MDNSIHHEFFLWIIKFRVFNKPRVCTSYMRYLLIKGFSEVLLNIGETIATSWVSYYSYAFESRILDVIFPNKASMICHILLERDLLSALTWFFIWIHDKDSVPFFMIDCPVYLRKHWANFKITCYTCRSSPNSRSHWSWSLNQHQSRSFRILNFLLFARIIKFMRHENFAFCIFVMFNF